MASDKVSCILAVLDGKLNEVGLEQMHLMPCVFIGKKVLYTDTIFSGLEMKSVSMKCQMHSWQLELMLKKKMSQQDS